MQTILLLIFAFLVGGTVTTYLTVNSWMAEKIGSETQVSLPYFLVALVVSTVLFFSLESPAKLANFTEVPWWMYLTGFAGAAAVYATTILVGELGPEKYFVTSVAGQVVISVVIAHFGWLGTEEVSIDWRKALGVALAISGAILVSYKG